MTEYFPESKSLGGRVKVELDLSNYDYEKKQIYKMEQVLIYQNLIKKLI